MESKKAKMIVSVVILLIAISFGLYYFNKWNIERKEEAIVREKKAIERDNIVIDEYNFEQLDKVKSILDPLEKDSYSFTNFKEFNQRFKQVIKPKKNCYFLASQDKYLDAVNGYTEYVTNGSGGYMFGFKIESDTYLQKYGSEYIVYPEYDIPPHDLCLGDCFDGNRKSFDTLISNPCKD